MYVDKDGYERDKVSANYYMAYHTILKNSEDYYSALRSAREIAANITTSINSRLFTEVKSNATVEVFPYRYLLTYKSILCYLDF